MHFRSCIAMLLLTSVLPVSVAHAKVNPLCTFDRVMHDAESVVMPCSETIADKAASDQDRGFALFIRGRAYHHTKRFDLARQDYDAAIALTPKNEELLVSRANIAFRALHRREGIAYLEKVLALNPNNGHALRSIGAVATEEQRYDEAVHYYTMALKDDPNDAYALKFRSEAYFLLRDDINALADADRLVSLPVADINAQGYLDLAGDKLDFHILALKTRAEIHDRMGHADLAEADLKSAIDYSRTPLSLSALGEYLAYKPGRKDEALVLLNEAIERGSRSAITYYTTGWIHLTNKDYKAALASFDRAAVLDPSQAETFQMRARVHRAFKETDAAVDDISHAVSIDPNVRNQTMSALRAAGYWRAGPPQALTQDLVDALRACMLDERCN